MNTQTVPKALPPGTKRQEDVVQNVTDRQQAEADAAAKRQVERSTRSTPTYGRGDGK